MYNNEEYIRDALKVLLPKYNLKREDLFITSKLGIHLNISTIKIKLSGRNNAYYAKHTCYLITLVLMIY